MVWLCHYGKLPANLNGFVHKDFLHSSSPSRPNSRTGSATAEPTKFTEHGAIQKGGVQCIVGAVGISGLLFIWYTDYCANFNKSLFIKFQLQFANNAILVCFNSTLNLFLYCWKIRESSKADSQASTSL